jgi:uncharacterized membrane protein YcaP (DUF421 family)
MLAVGTIGLLIVALSYVGYRWPTARSVIRGLPVVVLRNGEPDRAVLQVERLTLEELNEAAREQGIGDLGEVQVAVLEPDGKFSFIQKDSGDDGQKHQPEKLSG